jgi:PilZ domain
MKRLLDLTAEDLRESPVWRYEGGSGEDALVEPAARISLSREDDDIFLAATEFELADASRHFGFCFPADDSGLDYLQPVILTATGPVSFWFDAPATPETLARQWSALGRPLSAIFPATFRCLVPVDGRTVESRIERVETPRNGAAPSPGEAGAREGGSISPSKKDSAALEAPVIAVRTRGAPVIEKRGNRRRRTEMEVEFAQGALRGTGVTGDVSRRGMFVRSRELPGPGPLLRLTVNLPGGRRLELKGRVVRRAGEAARPFGPRPSGFGLRLAEEWPEYESLFPDRRKPD